MPDRTLSRIESRWYWAVHDLFPPLRPHYDNFAARMAKLTRGILLSCYDIGCIVGGIVQNESVYGARAVEQLAKCLGVPYLRLWELRNVAMRFSREELEHLAQRRMADGGHIAIEHVLLLAGIGRDRERRQLTERVFAEALTPRHLAKLIRLRDRGHGSRRPGPQPQDATAAEAAAEPPPAAGTNGATT